MRIIGGKYRSRVLAEFAGDDVRPTSDRAKESLFNILSLKNFKQVRAILLKDILHNPTLSVSIHHYSTIKYKGSQLNNVILKTKIR